jgi:CubicO group peptidase (beta-lactamase class C family)
MTRSARIHRDLPLPEHLAADLAPPHTIDAQGRPVLAPPLDPQGDGAAGGVVSSVWDLAKFDIALDEGRLIAPSSRERMFTPARTAGGGSVPYGVGIYVQEHQGQRLVWHSGWWEKAYSALYLKVPERRLTLIALANSEGLWWGNPLDEAHVERAPIAQAFLEAFAGSAGSDAARNPAYVTESPAYVTD